MKNNWQKKVIYGVSFVLMAASMAMILWYCTYGATTFSTSYEDGIKQIDLNTVYLEGSGVEVHFSDVILSKQQETRKLIVSEQTGAISMELTDRLIEVLDFDALTKKQRIFYTGKGYFVVDLDQLSAADIIQDSETKTLTIKINHAYLQAIEIDPYEIKVGNVKEGLFTHGDIKMSMKDYNTLEKQIKTRLEAEFNTAENGQIADKNALRMVKETYEPIIKAIDSRYHVNVEFK